MDNPFLRGMLDELIGEPVRQLGRATKKAATQRDRQDQLATEQQVIGNAGLPGMKETGAAPTAPPRQPTTLPDQNLLENVMLPRAPFDPEQRAVYDIASRAPARATRGGPPPGPFVPQAPPPQVPQAADIRFYEMNSGELDAPPPTPEQQQTAADREQGWTVAMSRAAETERRAQQADINAGSRHLAEQSDESRRAKQQTELDLVLSQREVERLIDVGQQSGYVTGQGVGEIVAGVGMDVIDKPRQIVIGELGDAAYRRATGEDTGDELIDLPDWLTGLAGEAEVPGFGSADFNDWANDPANAQIIRDKYENGFQAHPEAPKYTGGRAVWELYINTAGFFQKAAVDLALDPFNWLPGVGVVGKGAKVLSKADIIPDVLKPVLRATGTALQAPQVVLDNTADAVLPAVLRGVGKVATEIPFVGPWLKNAADLSPRVYLERKMAELVAATNRARATDQAMPAPALETTPVTAAIVPEPVAPPPAAPPRRTPPPAKEPVVVGTIDRDTGDVAGLETTPATATVQPPTRGPVIVGEQPAAPPIEIVDARGRVISTPAAAPPPATVSPWTDPNRVQQAEPIPTTIRSGLDAARATDQAAADRWYAEWEADIAAPYRADPTQGGAARGSARDPLAHVNMVVTSEGSFRLAFPDTPLGAYRYTTSETPAFNRASIQNMIEHGVFNPAEPVAKAVRKWFRDNSNQTFGPPIERAPGQPPRPHTGREIADEIKFLRQTHQDFARTRSFGATAATPTPTAAAESPLVSPEVRADAQAFTAPGPHPRRGDLSIGKERGAGKEQQIMLGGETTIFSTGPHKTPQGGAKTAVKRMRPDGSYEVIGGPLTRKEARETALSMAEDFLDEQGDAAILARPKLEEAGAARRAATTTRVDAEVAAQAPVVEPPAVETTAAVLPAPNAPQDEVFAWLDTYADAVMESMEQPGFVRLYRAEAADKATRGQWFSSDIDMALTFMDRLSVRDGGRRPMRLWSIDVPEAQMESFRAVNVPDAQVVGRPESDYYLPSNLAQTAMEVVPLTDEIAPAVERTAAGLQNVMPGTPDPVLRLDVQEVAPEARVLTPEEQRAAEVAAGQQDMFGVPTTNLPAPIQAAPSGQGFGAATGQEIVTKPRQLDTGQRAIYIGRSEDDTPVRIVEMRNGYEVHYARTNSATPRDVANGIIGIEWVKSDLPELRGMLNIGDPNDLIAVARSVLADVERTRQRTAAGEMGSYANRVLEPVDADADIAARAESTRLENEVYYPDAQETTGRTVTEQVAIPPGEVGLEEYRRVPRAALRLRPKDYQMRLTPHAEASAANIVDTYHRDRGMFKRLFHPIEVRDNGDGSYTVLSGHSRVEAANRLDLDTVPIRVLEGTDEEIEIAARLSNTIGTHLKPTENGYNLVRLLELTGEPLEAVADLNKINPELAQRYIDTTFLPQTLQDMVDRTPRKLPELAEIGKGIREGLFNTEEAFRYWQETASPNKWGVESIQDNLALRRRLKQGVAEQTGLFPGMDLGDTGFAATLAKATDLTNARRNRNAAKTQLAGIRTKRKKGIVTLSDQTDKELLASIDTLDQEIAALDAQLVAPATFGGVPGDVIGITPFAKINYVRGQRQANKAQAAAATARATAQQMPPGIRPLPLADDVTATLATRFQAHPLLSGETYEDTLTAILTQEAGVPTTLYTATDEQLQAAFGAFRREMKQEVGFKEAGKIGSALDLLSGAYSEWTLLLPWKAPRYIISNQLFGSDVQMAIGGQARALARANDPRHLNALIGYARHGGDPLNSPTGQLFVDIGAGMYHPKLLSDGMNSAVMGKGESNLRRLLNKTPKVKLGTLARPAEIGREISNGVEWAVRTGLAGHKTQQDLIRGVKPFRDKAVAYGRKHFPAIPEADLRANLKDLGWRVDAVSVRDRMEQLALSHGVKQADAIRFADRIGKDWANVTSDAIKAGVETVDATLFSYEYRNFDQWVKRVAPFHYWVSRAIPWYAKQGVRHPGLAAAYYKSWEGMENYAEEQNWPDSLKQFGKLWEGPGGLMMLFNPFAAVGLLDVFMEQSGGYTPENISLLGKIVNGVGEWGFGPLPWWGAALNWTGLMGDSIIGLDPIGTYGERKLFGGLVSIARAQGWIEGDPLSKPFEQRLRDIRAAVSGYTSKVIPGAAPIPATDASAYPREVVSNIMLDTYLEANGISREEFAAMGMAPEGSEEGERYDAIMEELLAEQETEGDLWMDAAQEYSEAQVGVGGFWNFVGTHLISGPKRIRQVGQMVRGDEAFAAGFPGSSPTGDFAPAQTGAAGVTSPAISYPRQDPYLDGRISANESAFLRAWHAKYGTPYNPGDLERLQATTRREKERSEWTPEAAPLAVAQSEYHTLGAGNDRARQLVDTWEDIAYGETPRYGAVAIGGVRYTPEQLRDMTQDQRFDLADAYLAERDTTGAAAKLREDRDLYVESHPEYALFKAWSSDTSKAWRPYGLAQYRKAIAGINPNAKRYFDEQTHAIVAQHPDWTASQIQDELDSRTLTLSAYEAVHGIQHKYADQTPLGTGERGPVYPPGYAPGQGAGGGSQASGGGWTERATTAISDTQEWLSFVNQALSGAYGRDLDYTQLPPPVRQSVDAMLAQSGVVPPEDMWIWEDYQEWSLRQRQLGGNPSVEAYVLATKDGPWRETQTVTLPGGGPTLVGGYEVNGQQPAPAIGVGGSYPAVQGAP